METQQNSGTPYIVGVIVVIILIGIGYYFWSQPASDITTSVNEGYSTSTPETSSDVTASTTAAAASPSPVIISQPLKNNMHTVTIETNKGTIVFETYDADAPKTAENFIKLANKG